MGLTIFSTQRREGAALLILVSLDSAPTMAGTVEVIYDSADGENFDTVVEQTDPSESPAAKDLTFLVGNPMPLLRGDKELYDGSDLSAGLLIFIAAMGSRALKRLSYCFLHNMV